jgi:predicted  nucleic acid-binding Zn-ribbon protein
MHADLVKLLELQAKDAVLSQVDQRYTALDEATLVLDQALQRAREALDAAHRALADGQRRRDELEAKIESYRVLQDRRRQRLEQVRNPKEAATLMAELDLTRSIMAEEENNWVRSADAVAQLEQKVQSEALNLKAVEAAQAPERKTVAGQRAGLDAERAAALTERHAAAALIEKPLRIRYDRLRKSRSSDVVVPLVGGSCGACHTAVPLNRRSQIKSGAVLDGCEACGAILYPSEPAGSA